MLVSMLRFRTVGSYSDGLVGWITRDFWGSEGDTAWLGARFTRPGHGRRDVRKDRRKDGSMDGFRRWNIKRIDSLVSFSLIVD